jgi:hypothetical protein
MGGSNGDIPSMPESEPPAPINYTLDYLSDSDKLSLKLTNVPDRGEADGIISGVLECESPNNFKIITVIQTDEGLSFPKPSFEEPFSEIGENGKFFAMFYTEDRADFSVPKITLYFVEKDYGQSFERQSNQEWAVSARSLVKLLMDCELAVSISRNP